MKKVLLSMLAILIATGCSFSLKNKVNEENKNSTNAIEKQTYESLNIDDSLVTELYNKIDYYLYYGPYMGYFYQKDSISVDDMDNKLKLYLALNNAETTSDESGDILLISDSSVKKAMEDLFGNIDYKNESLANSKPCGFNGAQYDESKKQYSIFMACGGTGYPYYMTKLVQARKYSDKIEIYEKHIAGMPSFDDESNMLKSSVYKDFKLGDNNETSDIVGIDLISENVDDLNTNLDYYMKQVDTCYKYTFKFENGKYHFYSAEKVK